MRRLIYLLPIAVILVLLVAFFYPKEAGAIPGGITAISKIEYDCIGFKEEYSEGCPDCPTIIYCWGMKLSTKKCYTRIKGKEMKVPCPDVKPKEERQPLEQERPSRVSPKEAAVPIPTPVKVLVPTPAPEKVIVPEQEDPEELNEALTNCNKIEVEAQRFQCVVGVALSTLTKDTNQARNICMTLGLQGVYSQTKCLRQLIDRSPDLEKASQVCNFLSARYGDEECLRILAYKYKNQDMDKARLLCNRIKDENLKKGCLSVVGEG